MELKFAHNLRYLRVSHGWKQAEVAAMVGITQRRISYLETGKIEPDLATLAQLAEVFDVSIDDLILSVFD